MASKTSTNTALDLLILTVLGRRGPMHGYGVAAAIEELSAEALRVEEGSLYPALHRMEEAGWVAASWTVTENSRRARMYKLTAAGRKQLDAERVRWTEYSAGVARVLQFA
jgi:transcriptional regulator